MRSVSCRRCKKSYQDYISHLKRSRRHYCSADCQRADRKGKTNPNWRGGPPPGRCRHCRKTFARYYTARAERKDHIFCSIGCKAAHQRGRARP